MTRSIRPLGDHSFPLGSTAPTSSAPTPDAGATDHGSLPLSTGATARCPAPTARAYRRSAANGSFTLKSARCSTSSAPATATGPRLKIRFTIRSQDPRSAARASSACGSRRAVSHGPLRVERSGRKYGSDYDSRQTGKRVTVIVPRVCSGHVQRDLVPD